MGRSKWTAVGIALVLVLSAISGRRITPVFATSYNSITIDGQCSDWAADEKLSGNDGTQTWITWDANNVYVGWLGGGDTSAKRVVAFDVDPGTSDGSSISYSGVTFPAAGQPDYVVEVHNNTIYYSTRSGSTLSTSTPASGATQAFGTCSGPNFVELSLSRSLLGNLATGAGLGVYSFFADGNNGYVYGGMPQGQISSGNPPQAFNNMEYFPTTDGGRSPASYGQVLTVPGPPSHDGNVEWNGLFADQSQFFMSPVQPVANGQLTLRFRSYHNDLTSANVNWYNGTSWNNWIPMSVVGQDATGKYDIWAADASALLGTGGTTYYRFQANDGSATTYYNAYGPTCGNGNQTSCVAPDSPNFWVIPGFTTPAWSQNATFYQIFPDRFRNGDPSNDVPYHAGGTVSSTNNACPAGSYGYGGTCAFTHSSWNDLPTQPAKGADFFGGDLAGIDQELDPYLNQTLGVNALYLNPIFASPSNHKYDAQDYYQIDPHFGTNTGNDQGSFSNLTAGAHNLGMSVMLDGVFNHTSDWNCWFNDQNLPCGGTQGAYQSTSSPYIGWYQFPSWPSNYCAWDGFGSLAQLNYSSSGVRDQIYRSAGSVMRTYLAPPYNVDGWRLDVADNYSDMGSSPGGSCSTGTDNHSIWQEIRSYLKGSDAGANNLASFPNALLLGEYWQQPTSWLGGDQWDSSMNYNGFNVPVSRFFTGQNVHGETDGYLTPSALSAWLTGTLADNNRSSQLAMLNSLTTHDTSRFLYRACTGVQNGSNTGCAQTSSIPAAAYAKLKMATELQMTYVGDPSIYYGDEIGMTGANDPDNRRPFDWNTADWNQDIFNTTRTLVFNRTAHEALRDGSFKTLVADDTNNVFAYGRFLLDPSTINTGAAPSDAAIVAFNNDGSNAHSETIDATQLSLTDGTVLTDIVNGGTYTVQNGQITLNLPANTGAVLVTGTPATVPAPASFPTSVPSVTQVSLTSSAPNGVASGHSITFTAQVTPSSNNINTSRIMAEPTGTVDFYDGTTQIGTGTLQDVGGVATATFTTSSLGDGTHSISANYLGDSSYNGNQTAATQKVGGSTDSIITTFTAVKKGNKQIFHWHVANNQGLLGFNISAAGKTLNKSLIKVHSSTTYKHTVSHAPAGPYTLHAVLTSGTEQTASTK